MSFDDKNVQLEKATKTEGLVLTKRARRYGVLGMAILGVLNEVNPSNGYIWDIFSTIGQLWGF